MIKETQRINNLVTQETKKANPPQTAEKEFQLNVTTSDTSVTVLYLLALIILQLTILIAISALR